MLTVTHNCRQKSCFSFLSIPAVGYKSSFSYSKKYILLHYNVVSRTYFHLYYFYNVSPLKISNHNAFYNFLLGYNALCTLDKMDRNRLLKDNTSLEAVTLIEESDNEVFKLLNLTINTYDTIYILFNFCVKCGCVT